MCMVCAYELMLSDGLMLLVGLQLHAYCIYHVANCAYVYQSQHINTYNVVVVLFFFSLIGNEMNPEKKTVYHVLQCVSPNGWFSSSIYLYPFH